MGIYIDMEMPTGNDELRLIIHSNGQVIIDKKTYWEETEAVPVPPHGRLIDADALMLKIQEYIEEYGWETDEHGWHNEKWCAMKEAAMAIDAAPTIIPAEEDE